MSTPSVFKNDIFKGKVAFVTGGGSGICKGMTLALMQHGCSAVILGRRQNVISDSAAELSKLTGQKCVGVAGDVRKPETLENAVSIAVKEFGHIDFVICGAAGNFLSPIEGLSSNAFKTVLEIDTIGTFNTVRATMAEVKKSKGSYIAVSATLHYRATFLQAHVSAAKAGVDALMKVLAVELGPIGVRANIIAPGPIEATEGMDRLMPKDQKNAMLKKLPLQRMGKISEIGDAGIFLFSPAAAYITGTVLVVDGGDQHTGGIAGMSLYPEILVNGGNAREIIKGKL